MRISNLMQGASASALILSGFGAQAAWAQTAGQDAPAAATADEAAPSSATPSDDGAIVVTGRRRALQAATDRKRNSDTIVDSVVADEAGKLPDNSITEVLQRVAGVSVVRFAALGDPDHFSVEGSGVQVRGLSGVASRLNGRDIFSANNGRALLWGDVTPELMQAVDVYKASTADLIEGGTGGQIDLRTKLPFDFKPGWHVAGSAEISRGDFAKKNDLSTSALLTNRWDTPIGEIGALVDIAFSRLSTNSNFFRMEPYYRTHIGSTDYFIPGGYDYGEDNYQRHRTGVYGAVQWAPSESLKLTGIFFQSRYRSRTIGQGAFVTSQTLAVNPNESEFDSIGGLISTPNIFQRDPNTFLPSGNAIASGGNAAYGRSNSVTRDYSLAFQFTPASSPLALSGALQRTKGKAVDSSMNIFRDVAFPTNFGLDLSGEFPEVTIPESGLAGFDDPANYFWSASMPHDSDNTGRQTAANLDAEYKFEDSFFRSVKVGGRWAKRTERDFDNGFNWAALGRSWNGDPQMTFANAAPGDVEAHVFENFFHGDIPVPTNMFYPSIDLVRRSIGEGRNQLHASPGNFCGQLDWGGGNPDYFNCSARGPVSETGYGGPGIRTPGFILPTDQTDYLTKTLAGYGLVRFGSERALGFSGNVGVRVVRTQNRSSGYFVQSQAAPYFRDGQLVSYPVTINGQPANVSMLEVPYVRRAGRTFTHVLPSINLQIAPSATTKARFAYNITMDNASFRALRASGGVGVTTTDNPNNPTDPNLPRLPPIFSYFNTSSGNPTLKPTVSNNLDLSFEWYPKQGTMFHLALFHKKISNLPIYAQTDQPVQVIYPDGTTEDVSASATDIKNATAPAKVKGFEIGGRTFFDMLPGLLRGFGVEANYTFVDSRNPGDLYRDIDGFEHDDAPVTGMSRHNYNATLMYELGRVSARIAYSWRSKYLQSTNANGTNPTYTFYASPGVAIDLANIGQGGTQIALPVYGSAYGQVDAGLRYKFSENVSLSLQGTNLLNATQRTLMTGYPQGKFYTRSWFQSDRRISAGVNVSF
jgi:iron complex outermembrane recepter protein